MYKNNDAQERKLIISMTFILALLETATITAAIFLPWWERIDSTVGPLQVIYLYKSIKLMPFEIKEYVWAVRDPTLKAAMLYPLVLVSASLLLSVISSIFLRKSKNMKRGIMALISGAASAASFFVFQHFFEGYMKTIGDTVSGSIGYLHWGFGIGSKLPLAATALMITMGALQIVKTEHFEIELFFEKETEEL